MFNLAITFIAAALLAPSAAAGQTVSLCVSSCLDNALAAGGCNGITDLVCTCTSGAFLTPAFACITEDCPDELDGAIAVHDAMCAAYGNGAIGNNP